MSKECRKQKLKAEISKVEIRNLNIQAPFGFVTGCHAGDKFMVQATLASMRHYCPAVPICLIVDGIFDVSDLEKEYGLIVLRVPDLPSAEMRKLIGGNYRAKLAAMWEGPFEFYVWMDSDAIVWGDFTPEVRRDLDFQIFWKEAKHPELVKTENVENVASDGFKHYYFDPQKLELVDPKFRWFGNVYFSAGVYGCKRGVISFKEWLQIENLGKTIPGLFSNFGDMGPLNYLVHAKAQRAEVKIDSADLQHIWAHHGKEELVKDCIGSGWQFPQTIRRPRVAHFCTPKPFLFDRKAYSRPFTIARLEHYRRRHGELGAWLAILNEDRRILAGKVRRRFKRYIPASVQSVSFGALVIT
jgi:hypothetical protein